VVLTPIGWAAPQLDAMPRDDELGADHTAGLGIGWGRGATSVGTDSHSEGEGAGSAKAAWWRRGFLWTHHESVRRATKEIRTWSVWSLLSFAIMWLSGLPLSENEGMDRAMTRTSKTGRCQGSRAIHTV
jgi:hypothetical protein